ncbi:MAG: isocitrate lyase/phosphoenolpyruvate mutase family protein [Rhizobiales bacterium]|nr:isocitrate lyase/phosphoenolpyruvate mutase family protein [Hyphomicrobiales bacterium]
MPSVAEKRRTFRDLHEAGCFVIPNPFDVGSARWLQGLGFPALATTSSGVAFAAGLPDGGISRDDMLAHIAALVDAADVPVNADYLNAFADDPNDVAENVTACIATGAAGISVEDSTGRAGEPLYDADLAVERVRAARKAIDKAGGDVLLVARAECFLTGHADPLEEALRRLKRFADAGADVLYAPGPRQREQIERIVAAVAPKPVNVLVSAPSDFTVADFAAMGVRRISVGGALSRAAWGGFMRAAEELKAGRFDGLAGAAKHADLDRFFAADQHQREGRT